METAPPYPSAQASCHWVVFHDERYTWESRRTHVGTSVNYWGASLCTVQCYRPRSIRAASRTTYLEWMKGGRTDYRRYSRVRYAVTEPFSNKTFRIVNTADFILGVERTFSRLRST